ncbi:MAG: winged helix-turn-helix domain-containing protein, partial [Verrucomicrobiota bacterium]
MSSSPSSPTSPPMRARAPKLAQRLVDEVSQRIRGGQLAPGSRIPGEHDMMREHGVSRAVVREAISLLQAAGLVEARQGLGTFVLEPSR